MNLALDAAGDYVFKDEAPEWDDADDLPAPVDMEVFECPSMGGYEVVLIRRAYSNTPGGSAHSADYAVESCSGPGAIYQHPDIQDKSEAYLAEQNREALETNTATVNTKKPTARF